MKLTNAQLAGHLARPEIFLRHYGLLMSVTAITTDVNEANAHSAEHGLSEGVLAEYGGFVFLADMKDTGREPGPLLDLARELVRALDNATPGEITDAARMLDELGCGFAGKATERLIARKLAPVFHKFRK